MNLETYVGYVFKLSIALAVFLAIVVLIYSGFEYMLSGAFETKSAARARMNNAMYGLLGALASYLILLTIDPRLVQINTSIPEIEVAIDSETANFQNKLSNDLKAMSNERREEVLNAQIKIASNKKRLGEINNILTRSTITPEERVELEKERISLISEDKIVRIEQIKTIYKGQIESGASNTFGIIDNLGNYTDNGKNFNGEDKVKFEIEKIKKGYTKNIELLGQLGDDSTDIKRQHDFYIDQINKEKEVALAISKYKSNDFDPKNEKKLNDLLNQYKTPIGYGNPYLNEQNKKFTDTRIAWINQTLKNPGK